MPILALMLYSLFLVVAFGWRTWLQYRRTGDHGVRGLAKPIGSLAWFGGLALVIGVASAALAQLLQLTGLVEPWTSLDVRWAHLVGLLTALVGIALTVWAQLQMGGAWRIGVDQRETTTLVTKGLFRYVRNPIFLGLLLSLAGLFMMVPNPISLGAFVLAVVGIEIQVREVEEPYLMRTHGDDYGRYARRAGRFLPAIGRFDP